MREISSREKIFEIKIVFFSEQIKIVTSMLIISDLLRQHAVITNKR